MLQREVILGPLAADAPTDLVNILRGPDELIHVAATISSDSMKIVIGERAPV